MAALRDHGAHAVALLGLQRELHATGGQELLVVPPVPLAAQGKAAEGIRLSRNGGTKGHSARRHTSKAWLMNGHEVQVDLGTGRVLQTAYRRSDLIETIHDGSFFAGDWTKLGLFLPSGIVVLLLWLSGLWMWWVPFAAKRAKKAREKAA